MTTSISELAQLQWANEHGATVELIIAEVNYLVSHGWIPTVEARDMDLHTMKFHRSPATTPPMLYTLEAALRLQKYLDPFFKEK